jgi:transcriptional regulator with XRE-family HTH domain
MTQGSFARKLRLLRAERGLSLREASKRTGVSKETLSDIERGRRHPHYPTLTKISKGYGVSLEALLNLAEEWREVEEPKKASTAGEATQQEEPVLAGKAQAR